MSSTPPESPPTRTLQSKFSSESLFDQSTRKWFSSLTSRPVREHRKTSSQSSILSSSSSKKSDGRASPSAMVISSPTRVFASTGSHLREASLDYGAKPKGRLGQGARPVTNADAAWRSLYEFSDKEVEYLNSGPSPGFANDNDAHSFRSLDLHRDLPQIPSPRPTSNPISPFSPKSEPMWTQTSASSAKSDRPSIPESFREGRSKPRTASHSSAEKPKIPISALRQARILAPETSRVELESPVTAPFNAKLVTAPKKFDDKLMIVTLDIGGTRFEIGLDNLLKGGKEEGAGYLRHFVDNILEEGNRTGRKDSNESSESNYSNSHEVETFSPQPEDRKSYALSEVFSTLSDSDDEQIFSPYVVPKRDPVLFRVKTKALRPKVVRPAAVSQKSISVAIEGGREQEDFSHAIKLFRDSEEAFSSIEPDGDATPSLTSSPSTHVDHSFRPESPDHDAFDVPRFEIFLDRNPMAYELITHFLRNSRLPLSLDVSRLSEKSDWKLDASFLLNTYLTLQEVKEEAKWLGMHALRQVCSEEIQKVQELAKEGKEIGSGRSPRNSSKVRLKVDEHGWI